MNTWIKFLIGVYATAELTGCQNAAVSKALSEAEGHPKQISTFSAMAALDLLREKGRLPFIKPNEMPHYASGDVCLGPEKDFAYPQHIPVHVRIADQAKHEWVVTMKRQSPRSTWLVESIVEKQL